jgi:hypothetical protein
MTARFHCPARRGGCVAADGTGAAGDRADSVLPTPAVELSEEAEQLRRLRIKELDASPSGWKPPIPLFGPSRRRARAPAGGDLAGDRAGRQAKTARDAPSPTVLGL